VYAGIMKIRASVLCLVFSTASLALPLSARGQNSLVDGGTFALTIEGEPAGKEEFSIRRAGLGSNGRLFAQAVVSLTHQGGAETLRPLLEARPPEGSAVSYQIKISGDRRLDVQLFLTGNRYDAVIRSDEGVEEREFSARPETRVIDRHVAHQYYFLHTLREGARAPVIDPTGRAQTTLTAGAWTQEEIRVAGSRVQARRVVFTSEDDERTVWYDRQGRVLRVEVPALGFVAVRTDVVG
jgi:hypothetical protein